MFLDISDQPPSSSNIPAKIPKYNGVMKVIVRLLSGRRFEIETQLASTVNDLKRRIEDKDGIPPDLQRLQFAGQKLDGRESLTTYNIQENSEIFLILKIGGPPRRRVTWTSRIINETVSNAVAPITDAQFTFELSENVAFLAVRPRFKGQNLWRNYWTGPEYRFTDIVISGWVVVLKLSEELSSSETKEELNTRLDAVRYNYQGINRSYYGGQCDSWQRYTTVLPVRTTLRVTAPDTFTLQVTEPLEPDTWYSVVFLNNFCTANVYNFYEDYLLPFKTAGPEPTPTGTALLDEDALNSNSGAVQDSFICPIGLNSMVDPVVCVDGYSYDRVNIEHWLLTSDLSPKTNMPLSSHLLIPNHTLRAAIQQYGKP